MVLGQSACSQTPFVKQTSDLSPINMNSYDVSEYHTFIQMPFIRFAFNLSVYFFQLPIV